MMRRAGYEIKVSLAPRKILDPCLEIAVVQKVSERVVPAAPKT